MIREFHLADWFTLGNAVCGVGALFSTLSYIERHDVAASRAGARKARPWGASWTRWPT